MRCTSCALRLLAVDLRLTPSCLVHVWFLSTFSQRVLVVKRLYKFLSEHIVGFVPHPVCLRGLKKIDVEVCFLCTSCSLIGCP